MPTCNDSDRNSLAKFLFGDNRTEMSFEIDGSPCKVKLSKGGRRYYSKWLCLNINIANVLDIDSQDREYRGGSSIHFEKMKPLFEQDFIALLTKAYEMLVEMKIKAREKMVTFKAKNSDALKKLMEIKSQWSKEGIKIENEDKRGNIDHYFSGLIGEDEADPVVFQSVVTHRGYEKENVFQWKSSNNHFGYDVDVGVNKNIPSYNLSLDLENISDATDNKAAIDAITTLIKLKQKYK